MMETDEGTMVGEGLSCVSAYTQVTQPLSSKAITAY